MAGLRVIIDTGQLQSALGASRAELTPAMRRFFQRIAALVDSAAVKNAAGHGAPGSYPIPMREGALRQSIKSEYTAKSAMVFSNSGYADAQQRGYHPYGNPRATPIPPRPFTHDAARQAPIEDELADALARVFP